MDIFAINMNFRNDLTCSFNCIILNDPNLTTLLIKNQHSFSFEFVSIAKSFESLLRKVCSINFEILVDELEWDLNLFFWNNKEIIFVFCFLFYNGFLFKIRLI